MIRKIIQINEEKCNGCGLCAKACHEGAIGMVNGKATLLRDDYCDGLGDCLPVCPTNAITFVQREAAEYDEQAVAQNKLNSEPLPCGCPGTQSRTLSPADSHSPKAASQLRQWPVQIRLAPVNAPYFQDAHLLIAADCAAYAYGNFHHDFIKGRVTLIGCPKLDDTDYADKLTDILLRNNIASITVARMEVPCCGGLEHAVKRAITQSGKSVPCKVRTISTDGEIC